MDITADFFDTATRWEAAAEASAAAVDADGEWFLDTTSDVLTLWNAALDTPAQVEITLTGVVAVTSNANATLDVDFTA